MKTINDRWPPSPSPKALDKTHHLNNPKDHAVIAPDNTTDFARPAGHAGRANSPVFPETFRHG